MPAYEPNAFAFWHGSKNAIKLLTPFKLAIGGVVHLIKKAIYKSYEYDADKVAVEILIHAGLTQRSAIRFFEKLMQMEGSEKSIFKNIVFFIKFVIIIS